MKAREKIIIASLLSLGSLALGASLGSTVIPVDETVKVLAYKLFGIAAKSRKEARIISIVWNMRFPRVVLAFMIGGSLSVSGAVFQSVLKNQLASPHILGVSSGASLGAGLVLLTGFTLPFAGMLTLPASGFIFGLLTVLIVIGLSSRLDKTMSNNTIILFGMIFSLFINAILTTITALYREETKTLLNWQLGSFAMKGWSYTFMMLPFLLIGCLVIVRYTREMDILTFGEDEAQAMGVDARKVRKRLMAASAFLTGAAVALSGVIGFIDLIAPHIARKIVGSSHRYVIPFAFLTGGPFLVIADLIARTVVSPSELPVGVVTALVGAPFFAWVYFGKKNA
jgi:iron complex transport system permease protein